MKIDLVSDFNKVQNIGLKKVENNSKNSTECHEVIQQSTVDLQSSTPEAVTYTASGGYRRNLNNKVIENNDV